MSWGSPNKEEKFYKGAKTDTAWNKDLLWRYHVNKEVKQAEVNAGERPPDPALQLRHGRMRMGITGTLIPDVTPRFEPASSTSSVDRPRVTTASTQSRASRAGSVRSSTSSWRSSSSSSLSVSSSQRSVKLEDVQRILENESRLLQEKASGDVAALRQALDDEAKKREAAERKLALLCEKLGVHDA